MEQEIIEIINKKTQIIKALNKYLEALKKK